MNKKANNTAVAETFHATFVPADKGLQTEERVNGRRAFPARRGARPKLGETWLVTIDGENPNKTVHFVRCIELICGADAIAQEAPVNTPAITGSPVVASVGKKKAIAIDPVAELITLVNLWLFEPATTDLQNLRLVFAHKCLKRDSYAVTLRDHLQTCKDEVTSLAAQINALVESVRSKNYWEDRTLAERLHLARSEMARLKAEAKQLQSDTLAYGRMVQLQKAVKRLEDDTKDYANLMQKLGVPVETSVAELEALVTSTKEALDQRRAAHKEAMAACKASLEPLELDYVCLNESWEGSDKGDMDEVLELLNEKAAYQSKHDEAVVRLGAALAALKERVAVLVTG